jgi:hypothetical protein
MAVEPFRSVVTEHGDPISQPYFKRCETGCCLRDQLPVFFPGDSIPDTEILATQSNLPAKTLDTFVEKLRKTGGTEGHHQVLLFL